MITKQHLHRFWMRIRPLKTGYLLAAFLLVAGVHMLALRANYSGMYERRNLVYQADKDNQNIEQALQALRAYVASHMNTNLSDEDGVYPPIQLMHTYERLVQAEKQRVDAINTQIYTEAQKHCEALHPGSFSGGPRVPCIAEYVKSHGTTARSIPDAQYKFDFVSPAWSPDLAGWSMVLGAMLLALTVVRFALGRWLYKV